MQIALLSNTNIEPLSYQLKNDVVIDVFVNDYGEYINHLVEDSSPLATFSPDVVFLHIDGAALLRDAEQNIDFANKEIIGQIEFIINSLKNFLATRRACIGIISSVFFRPYFCITHMDSNTDISFTKLERRINKTLESFVRCNTNIYLLDINRLINLYGYINLLDEKYWCLGRIRFNDYGTKILSKAIISLYTGVLGLYKKVLVLDLDNTIWGGVLGEDGINGIQLSEDGIGKAYRAFQRSLKAVQTLGVLLCINSKNDSDDVADVLKKHPMMILKDTDFAVKKINWNDKYENMHDISNELGLGLDSFVFLDDHPVERELIRSSLPEIAVPTFPDDVFSLQQWFVNDIVYNYFPRVNITKEDKDKTSQYSRNAKRITAGKKTDKVSFLKNLNMAISVYKNDRSLINRIAQLTSKTNQFSIAKQPYSVAEIEKFLDTEYCSVYAVGYEDKFGYEGIIGVAIVRTNHDFAFIDSLLISCRVVGRGVEYAFITELLKDLKKSVGCVKLSYRPTKRNIMVKSYLENCGLSSPDNHDYQGDIEGSLNRIPEAFIDVRRIL